MLIEPTESESLEEIDRFAYDRFSRIQPTELWSGSVTP